MIVDNESDKDNTLCIAHYIDIAHTFAQIYPMHSFILNLLADF